MNDKQLLKCYIAAYHIPLMDNFLEENGFSKGMILFAIPNMGILFRCRVEGELINLEFGAFFSLLKFLTTDLKDEKIREIMVISSNPEFIFSFSGNSKHLKNNPERSKMVKEYQKKIQISIGYLEPLRNKALASAVDYPSLPESKKIKMAPMKDAQKKPKFQPFQKGPRL